MRWLLDDPVMLLGRAVGGPASSVPVDPDPPSGPLRPLTPSLPWGIALEGHSSLQPVSTGGVLAAAIGGPVLSAGDRQSSQEAWEMNGPARTADYDMLIVSESDSYTVLYEGLADPASSYGINNLQHLYWLGLEAKDRVAEFVLFNSPSARSNNVDATNRQRMAYYRQWLAMHLDMDVWILDGSLYVQELRDRGLTDDQIFADQVHLREGDVRMGAAWQAVAFVTGALPAGATGLYADAALASVQRHWWSGLGGADHESGLSIADPLPDPAPRPGSDPDPDPQPEPVDGILWTAGSYHGPELTGNQPVISGSVMTFDGSGLTADFVSSGFYACMAIRPGDLVADGYLLFLNPNPSDTYADPFHGLKVSQGHGAFIAERWPDPGEAAAQAYDGPDWVVVEGWVHGTRIGGPAGDNTVATSAPETPAISLMAFGRPIECSYLRIERDMPDETARAIWRVAAAATMPETP